MGSSRLWPPLPIPSLVDPSQLTNMGSFTLRGDIRSFNWDGGSDLSSGADAGATLGFFLDASAGAVQFQQVFGVGGELGDLNLTGSLFMVGGASEILTSDGTGFHMRIASGHSNQIRFMNGATEIGRFGVAAPTGAGEFQADSDIDITSGGEVTVITGSGADFTVLANAGAGGRVSLVGDVSSMLIGGTSVSVTGASTFQLGSPGEFLTVSPGSLATPAYGISDTANISGMYLPAEGRLNFGAHGAVGLQLRGDVPDFVSLFIADNTTASAANVFCSASGIVERVTSSARFKTAIRPWDRRFDVLALEPVLFRSTTKADDSRKVRLGLLAEHVAEVFPMAATPGLDGTPEGIDWSTLTAALIGEVADLRRRLEAIGG